VTRASTFLTTRSFAGRSADVPSERTRQLIPTLPDVQPVDTAPVATTVNEYDSSISLDVLIAISAGRIEALADLVHGREPNEERAFARTTLREVWRPVFFLAYREQIGLSASAEKGGE